MTRNDISCAEPPSRRDSPQSTVLALASLELLLIIAAALLIAAWGVHAGFESFQAVSAWLGGIFWSNITILGDFRVLVGLISPFSYRRPRLLVSFWMAALFADLLARCIRWLLPLPRPLDVLEGGRIIVIGIERFGHSFPSTHAAMAWCFASLCMAWGGRKAAPTILMAIFVSFSRVAVGAHWPIDTIVGGVIGVACGFVSWSILNSFRENRLDETNRMLIVLSVIAASTLPFDSLGYPDSMLIRYFSSAFAWFGLGYRILQRSNQAVCTHGSGRRKTMVRTGD